MNKNQELEALYDTVAQLYFKNIQFLTKHYPALLQKIKAFESLKRENYFLEFIDNHFELVDSKGKHYYRCNPFFDALHRCKNIDEKPSFNLLKTSEIKKAVCYRNSINAFEYINEYLQLSQEQKSNGFEKFVFLGTLLGVHLNDLANVLHSNVYLILEQNIEIFRLSLFLTDYEALNCGATLFFCINEDENSLNDSIKQFLKYKTAYNHRIGFEVSHENSLGLIDAVTKACIDYDPYNYPFSEYLVSLKRAFFYKQHSYYGILNCQKKETVLTKPILFLGAGPSLAKSIEWVYLHQDAFIVVCAAACLRRLELLDIVPDMILSVDGQYKQVIRQFDVNEKYYQNSLIIASSKTNEEVIKKQNQENTFFMSDNIEVFENTGIFTGVTVGDVGLDLLLRLGANDIYMLGFDACVSKTGKTHDTLYKNNTVKIQKSDVLQNSGLNTQKDLIGVKGNFEEEVYTFVQYAQMIDSIASITSNLSKDVRIFNLSHGAYFQNTTPLKKERIVWENFSKLNKSNIHNEIKQKLISLSSKTLTQKDLRDIKQEQKIIKKLKTTPLAKLEKEFVTLKSSYKNALSLQIIEKCLNLLSPYNQAINTQESQELHHKHLSEVIRNLEKFYLTL
jgi:hypothetical protein